jgi:hypothetical protein
MLAAMPRALWLQWIAYAELEPWGEERADVRAAIVASTVYNCLSGRRSPRRRMKDFMAHVSREPVSDAKIEAFKAWLRPFARPLNADADKPNR